MTGMRTQAHTHYSHLGPRINPRIPTRLTWTDLKGKDKHGSAETTVLTTMVFPKAAMNWLGVPESGYQSHLVKNKPKRLNVLKTLLTVKAIRYNCH